MYNNVCDIYFFFQIIYDLHRYMMISNCNLMLNALKNASKILEIFTLTDEDGTFTFCSFVTQCAAVRTY